MCVVTLLLHRKKNLYGRERRTSNTRVHLQISVRVNDKIFRFSEMKKSTTKYTSASPTGHGGATGHRTTQRDPN